MSGPNSLKKREAELPLNNRTIEEALQGASFCLQEAGIEQPRKEAEYLLSRILKIDRLQLFLRREEFLSTEVAAVFDDVIRRRCRHEPAAYIAGEKEFYGHRFIVNRDVLIPRPETELIVDCALQWACWLKGSRSKPITCVDLGTGSGALAVTLARLLPDAEIWAVDISGAALQVARVNAEQQGVQGRIRFLHGNYFAAFDGLDLKLGFNLIVSNPPYLGKKELLALPEGVRDYEPVGALDAGADGLDGYRLILDRLGEFANIPAVLLLEVGAGQKEDLEKLCKEAGLFKSLHWQSDLNGWPRVLEGLMN